MFRIINAIDIEFIGFVNTNIVYSTKEKRWEIVSTFSKNVLAFMNGTSKFPIGSHRWYFIQSDCVDEGEKYRTLNFHKNVEQPGNFCCNDGACFPSEYVNDGVKHCEFGEDESDYPLFEVPKYHNKFTPPIEVDVFLNIVDIFTINEADSTFDVYFSMIVMWKDKKIKFASLTFFW